LDHTKPYIEEIHYTRGPNVVSAGTRSPLRTTRVAHGPILKIKLAWSMSSQLTNINTKII